MKNIIIQKGEHQKKITGIFTLQSFKNGKLVQEIKSPNLVMQGSYTGSNQFLKRLIGDTTYTGIINYIAIGTSATAPAISDTQLTAETARAIISTAVEISTTQARIKTFFTDAALANGTYREVGAFIDGTGSANSGKIFNHALFSTPYSKSTGTDTTIQLDIFFS